MKRSTFLFVVLVSLTGAISAKPVTKDIAQKVGANYCSQNYKEANPNLTLAYTEYAKDGQAAYYVFNINTNGGFVIVSAEDAVHPVLAFSNEGKYVMPNNNNNVGWWMNCRRQEIELARAQNMTAASGISDEWAKYSNNASPKTPVPISGNTYLVKSTWDQPSPYNAMCPSGSVTGCVATTMAQIMRYWQYPPRGHGSSGYWDEKAYGYQENYGYLSADYDTSNYVWSAMPLSVTSANKEVAKLMYDAGVSVDMDYSPGESGAYVITGDDPISAQASYVKYFGYNPATIQGLYESKYDTTNWRILIENEITHNRPVQYVGFDSVQNAGHTWVCDGYNPGSTPFHMNWGWSGYDNGWFAPHALNASGYNFNWWNEAVIGIEPPAASPCFVASPTFGCKGMTVQYTDQSVVPSNVTITSRTWLFPGGTPNTSTALNPSVQYNTAGTYNVSEIISDASGTDTLVRQAYISVDSSGAIPFEQDFQAATFPPAGWTINNPNLYNDTWQAANFTGGYGNSNKCMYFDNCQSRGNYIYGNPGSVPPGLIGQRQQIYTPEYDYTGITNPKLYFDVAYAPFSSVFSDTLDIYYSTDCGSTFIPIYSKGGLTLGTTHGYVSAKADTNNLGCFVPLNYQWRVDTIYIPAIAGVNNVMFSFENRSGNGSPLYIDNINIPGVVVNTGIPSVSSNPSVKVWPNPTNGLFTIGITNVSGNSFVKIYNVLGQEVYTSSLTNDNTQINMKSQPKGVYIYRVFSETGSAISTGRLVVE